MTHVRVGHVVGLDAVAHWLSVALPILEKPSGNFLEVLVGRIAVVVDHNVAVVENFCLWIDLLYRPGGDQRSLFDRAMVTVAVCLFESDQREFGSKSSQIAASIFDLSLLGIFSEIADYL